MQRWRLSLPLGKLSRRILSRLARLRNFTTPRVQAAVFRTLWNGWTTKARFQQHGCCVLGCSDMAQDRIEHYACCPHLRALVTVWLGLNSRLVSLEGFLLAADSMTDQELCLIGVAAYAMHRATAYYRVQPAPNAERVHDFLQATCQGAVRGHPVSSKMLDEATRRRHIPNGYRASGRSRSPHRRA